MWYKHGPVSSTPPINKATPKGLAYFINSILIDKFCCTILFFLAFSSPSVSPKLKAKSLADCVKVRTLIGSLYVNLWF